MVVMVIRICREKSDKIKERDKDENFECDNYYHLTLLSLSLSW
jgi:hypothetical protein